MSGGLGAPDWMRNYVSQGGLRKWTRAGLVALAIATDGLPGSAPPAQAASELTRDAPGLIERGVRLTPRRAPLAHIRFCIVYEGQCDTAPDRRDPSRRVQDHWNEVVRVNSSVNRAIRPRHDAGFDTWNIDFSEGDCEDYALQKRSDLVALGWPTDHLRIALGRTRQGEPHAVLLVRIDSVDYALDNLTQTVHPWDKTGHRYLMLQDRHDPGIWHDIAPRKAAAGTS